jgi:hypothetical protein
MRSHPSIEDFLVVLAALGASAAVACGGATPQPVQASEVTVAPAAAPAASPAPDPAPLATPSPVAASTAAASPTPAAAAPAAAVTPTPASKPVPKAVAKKAPRAEEAGEASCGAGTCSGDTKKKIL